MKLAGALTIMGVLCALLGFLAAQGQLLPMLALIALPLGIVGMLFANRYFQTLMLLLPITALTMPIFQLSTGTGSAIPWSLALSLLLIGLWGTSMLNRGWDLPISAMNRPLFIFIVICILSLPWGIVWRDPVLNMAIMGKFIVTQTASLATMVASMIVPFLIGRFINQTWQIKFYLGAFMVCGAFMTITQFFRINQSFLNDRGLWGLWHVAPLFGLLVVQPGVRWYWRLLCAILIAANLYQTVIVNSLWISGWLPTVIGMIAMIFFHSRKLFFISLVVGLLLVTVGPGRSYIEHVTQDNVDEGGLERLGLWQQNWSVVSAHWLFGTGPAGYAAYYMTYFRHDARSTHNNYLDILAQFGFVGMIVWLWFSVTSVIEGWLVVSRAPPGILRTTAVVAIGGWCAALGSMMLGDWILPFAYNQGMAGFRYTVYSWIFLGLLISVRQMLDKTEQPSAEPIHITIK